MASKTKKVILFIVEGPTDEDALSPVLKKIFQNEEVRFAKMINSMLPRCVHKYTEVESRFDRITMFSILLYF